MDDDDVGVGFLFFFLFCFVFVTSVSLPDLPCCTGYILWSTNLYSFFFFFFFSLYLSFFFFFSLSIFLFSLTNGPCGVVEFLTGLVQTDTCRR